MVFAPACLDHLEFPDATFPDRTIFCAICTQPHFNPRSSPVTSLHVFLGLSLPLPPRHFWVSWREKLLFLITDLRDLSLWEKVQHLVFLMFYLEVAFLLDILLYIFFFFPDTITNLRFCGSKYLFSSAKDGNICIYKRHKWQVSAAS